MCLCIQVCTICVTVMCMLYMVYPFLNCYLHGAFFLHNINVLSGILCVQYVVIIVCICLWAGMFIFAHSSIQWWAYVYHMYLYIHICVYRCFEPRCWDRNTCNNTLSGMLCAYKYISYRHMCVSCIYIQYISQTKYFHDNLYLWPLMTLVPPTVLV